MSGDPGPMARALASNLVGVTAGTWLGRLRENRFRVDPPFWPRALVVTVASLLNSVCRRLDEMRVATAQNAHASLPDPLFILGHWRSGTTLLHNLFAADRRFASPDLCQVFFPDSFLTLGRPMGWLLRRSMPTSRLIDNMVMDPDLPQEDEFALCVLTGLSPYLAYAFPSNWNHYDRYLTFAGVSVADVRRWQDSFCRYVDKLSRVYGRPLVLKSPPHTARLRLILEIFPGARFVHVHRNPFAVFQSTRWMLSIGPRMAQLQRFDFTALDDVILARYEAMYDAFLAQRALIPEGRLCTVAFDDLIRDPVGELKRIYEALSLPDFAAAAPDLRRYAVSLGGYRRNHYPILPDAVARRIAGRWQRFFAAWGYSTETGEARTKPHDTA